MRPPGASVGMLRAEVIEFLENLRGAGFDVRGGVSVEQYLGFDMGTNAHDTAEELRRDGFDVDVENEDDGWVAYVTKRTAPTPGEIVRVQERVQAAAGAHAGRYEGWNLVPLDQGDVVDDGPDIETP